MFTLLSLLLCLLLILFFAYAISFDSNNKGFPNDNPLILTRN